MKCYQGWDQPSAIHLVDLTLETSKQTVILAVLDRAGAVQRPPRPRRLGLQGLLLEPVLWGGVPLQWDRHWHEAPTRMGCC
jgi:hypothetical protein